MSEQLYRFTRNAFDNLYKKVGDNLKYYNDPDTKFDEVIKKILKEPGEYRVPVKGVRITGSIDMMVKDEKSRQMADAGAIDFYNAFEGMTPALASDARLLAYLNHFYLHKYGHQRWEAEKNRDAEWFQRHWFSSGNRQIYEQNVAGRTWWLAHIAITSAKQSGGAFDAKDALGKFAADPEYYHRTMQYTVLRNPLLRAECVRAILNEANGVNRDGYREILMDLNREAGARLLDVLDRSVMRDLVMQSATRVMSTPDYVKNRKDVMGKKKLKVLSLGAGAQSTVLALMADIGWEGLERPDIAIFADTQWEPPNVYKHLEWLEKQLSYKVVRISAGNIRENILNGVNSTGQKFMEAPVFMINNDGTQSVAARQCTAHYKINPITQELRKILQIPAGRTAPKDVEVEMWMGISTDEAARMKPNRTNWIINRYPLIEMDMSRADIYAWFYKRHPDRHLPRSACVGCPYHDDMEWKWIKENEPESFNDAAYVDWALRNIPKAKGTMKGTGFLHHSRKPLSDVDLDDAKNYDDFMANECEGLCGV